MTLLPHWMLFVRASPSVTSNYEQHIASHRDAMGYAALAVALAVWRRASPVSRVVLGFCMPANLYTILLVASGHALPVRMGG